MSGLLVAHDREFSFAFNTRLGVEAIRITDLHGVHRAEHHRDIPREEEDRKEIKRSCCIIFQVAIYVKLSRFEITGTAA